MLLFIPLLLGAEVKEKEMSPKNMTFEGYEFQIIIDKGLAYFIVSNNKKSLDENAALSIYDNAKRDISKMSLAKIGTTQIPEKLKKYIKENANYFCKFSLHSDYRKNSELRFTAYNGDEATTLLFKLEDFFITDKNKNRKRQFNKERSIALEEQLKMQIYRDFMDQVHQQKEENDRIKIEKVEFNVIENNPQNDPGQKEKTKD